MNNTELMLAEEERRRREEERLQEQRLQMAYMRSQQQQQQQGGGMNPMQGYNMYQQFAGGGAGGSGAATGATGSAAGSTSAATGAGSGAAGSGSGFMAAAGPWAALAAAIAANETWANSEGRRPDDFGEHMGDLFTGKVLERDAEALGDSVGGPMGEVIETAGQLAHPKGQYDVAVDVVDKGKDAAKWLLKPWEWF